MPPATIASIYPCKTFDVVVILVFKPTDVDRRLFFVANCGDPFHKGPKFVWAFCIYLILLFNLRIVSLEEYSQRHYRVSKEGCLRPFVVLLLGRKYHLAPM